MSESNQDIQTTGLRQVINRTKELETERAVKKPKESRIVTRKHAIAKAMMEQSANLAITDSLTGLHNRRWFDDELKRKIAESKRSKQPLYLAYIDFDDFKRINTEFEHSGGDAVLRLTTQLHTRPEEPISRLGGDEFGQIFGPERVTIHEIAQAIDRHKKSISENSKTLLQKAPVAEKVDPKKAKRETSLSFGIALYEGETPEELLAKANKALHHTKNHGKNAAYVAVNSKNGEGLEFNMLS